MSEATERLRRHVASYKWTSTHRENCLDVCDELDAAQAEIERLTAKLSRLASPLAFGPISRTSTEEEVARMKYAEEALPQVIDE